MRFFKRILYLLPAAFLFVPFSRDLLGKDYLFSEDEVKLITKVTANLFAREHYLKEPLDNIISEKLFNEYLKSLDPMKIYLTKSDVESFASERDKLDEQILDGNFSFALRVHDKMREKLNEFNFFAKKIISEGLSFSEDENWSPNRDNADWPADSAEQSELWRKKIKNDVLMFRAPKKNREIDEPKNGGKDKKNPWLDALKPEEKVLKRYENTLRIFDEYDTVDKLELYLTALANAYDPHSSYMSPKSVEDFNIQMSLSLVGIGATLTQEDGYTKVVSLVPGGPADLSGKISPEDRIIAVAQANEESVDAIDMPLSKVVRMIRGPKDSIVKLTVLKGLKGVGGIPTDIEIKRDIVKLKDQEAGGEIIEKEVDGKKIKLGVISLESFYFDWEGAENGQKEIKSSTSDVKKILDRFNAEKIDGLILDLRANGGGSLYEAITLTGLFIKSGPIVQIKTRENRTEVKGDVDNEIAYSGPMLVLVSRISASASEIFAGAMKDYNRAIIVGDAHTHGKGSVQTVFSLREILKYWGTDTDSGSVKITNAKFYRINGESTQKKGIVSDIILPFPADAMEMGESFLQNVLEWDKISPVTHSKWYPQELYTPVIAELKNNSEKRMASDPEFQKICSNIVFFQDEKKKNLVSLNEEKRIQSFLEEKERIDKQIKLFKIDEDEIQKDATGKDSKRNDDTYLKEAINIISDFITHSINKK